MINNTFTRLRTSGVKEVKIHDTVIVLCSQLLLLVFLRQEITNGVKSDTQIFF